MPIRNENGRKTTEDLFPLRCMDDILELFRFHLREEGEKADLATLSIVAGLVEDTYTNSRICPQQTGEEEGDASQLILEPEITWNDISALRQKFVTVIRGYCDLSLFSTADGYATRDLVKRVSDILWNTLRKDKIKDKTHLSNLFSYLTESKLDCFGVALGVVAGCQILGFNDVHLALSEDHAWVVHGRSGEEATEVTWHEKQGGDRRGEDVCIENRETMWVYAGGCPVVCTRSMEVAAIVVAICPSITQAQCSREVSSLQQKLLWILYDLGHIDNYPMALGNLGNLEEMCPSPGTPSPSQLYAQSIRAGRELYKNRHVYPYIYAAGQCHRAGDYKQALGYWALASGVLRSYTHHKDDEEIYKEFMEINNECIPLIFKTNEGLLRDPECFSSLIEFYDGLCCWEENSSTPVLHVGWVKPMVKCVSSFDAAARVNVHISTTETEGTEDRAASSKKDKGSAKATLHSAKMIGLQTLFKAERMNTSTLHLQLTALSQGDVRRKPEGDLVSGRSKRPRKD